MRSSPTVAPPGATGGTGFDFADAAGTLTRNLAVENPAALTADLLADAGYR